MYFWNSHPFVRLSLVLILGIYCFDQFSLIWKHPVLSITISVLSYVISIFLSEKSGFYKLRHINGFLALTTIFYFGGFLTKAKYYNTDSNHYKNLNIKISGFSGIVNSSASERPNHIRYDLQLSQLISGDSIIPTNGTIYLYVQKDSLPQQLTYGDQINVYGRIYSITAPGNPSEFDYKSYLARQGIHGHAFVSKSDVNLKRNIPPNIIMKWAFRLRNEASEVIDTHIPQTRENGIVKALLLGIKEDLDTDLKKAYASAGAMHVLAVSGLHVGIIYLLIKLVLGKLRNFGNKGKYLFGILSTLLIWLYAIVTGLSPSVLRAATMFSIVAISEASTRESNIYNSLGLAAFILLLFDPYLIYSVGFQLSFAAVIGIVYLQPRFYRLLSFRFLILDKAWMLTCVSLAAQLSTFPLTAYYFHQFPTYFLVSNLVVIPASFMMLLGGLCMLILHPILAQGSEFLGFLLQHFTWTVNETISFVHVLPNSLIEWIYMDLISVFLTYATVMAFLGAIHFGEFKTLVLSGLLFITIILRMDLSHRNQSNRKELIFYETSKNTAIDFIEGHRAMLFVNEVTTEEAQLLAYQINPHRLASHLPPIDRTTKTFKEANFITKDVLRFGQIASKKMLMIDSTTFHLNFIDTIKTDYIIINNGSVKNLAWLKKHFTFKMIVISSKNPPRYTQKMVEQANENGVKLHAISMDGALRIPLP